jgi:hypothetical protein
LGWHCQNPPPSKGGARGGISPGEAACPS